MPLHQTSQALALALLSKLSNPLSSIIRRLAKLLDQFRQARRKRNLSAYRSAPEMFFDARARDAKQFLRW
jgi:hypothetical protein